MTVSALANDKYRATLRSTYIDGDTTLNVTAIPTNVPTVITVGWDGIYETVFRIEATTGTNSSNYALTGVARVKGYVGNIPENTSVNCLNNEYYFNQWGASIDDAQDAADAAAADAADAVADVAALDSTVNSTWVDSADGSTITFDLATGVNRKFRVTLGGNRTLAVSNPKLGQVFLLRLTNDGTARTPVWFSTIKWIGIEDAPAAASYVAANKVGEWLFICTNLTGPLFDGFFLGAEV